MNTGILRSNIITKIVLALFLLFLYVPGYSQEKVPFKEQWQSVDYLVRSQRPVTAIKYLEIIEQKALAAGNELHYILSRALHISFQRYQSEGSPEYLKQFEAEVKNAPTPLAKALWSTITANSFYNYFDNNKSKLYNNKNFQDSGDNYSLYTANQILNKAKGYYLQALKDGPLLQNSSVNALAPLFAYIDKDLAKQENVYVSILNTALDFFKKHPHFSYFDADNKKVAPQRYLITREEFMQAALPAPDTAQNLDIAMYLYRDIMHYYQQQHNPEEFVFYEINRLEYLKQECGRKKLDPGQYKRLLDQVISDWPDLKSTAKARYLSIKNIEEHKSELYVPGAFTFQQQLAKDYQAIIERHPGTEGAAMAYNSIIQLKTQELGITTEQTVIPNEPIRALIKYKNIDTLNIKIYQKHTTTYALSDSIKGILYTSENFILPKGNDMEAHTIELNLGKLPAGYYQICLSSDSVTVTKSLQVSNLVLMENDAESYLFNRKTGALQKNWNHFWLVRHEGKTSIIPLNFETNAEPVKIAARNKWIINEVNTSQWLKSIFTDQYFYPVILGYAMGQDTLIEKTYIRPRTSANEDTPKEAGATEKTFYFIDRPIYRPGHAVHFKGFVLSKHNTNKVLANRKIKVTIDDVNGDTVFEQEFTSNEFGTFSGTFHIPEQSPLGTYEIYDDMPDGGYRDFEVEAYKKPQMTVTFEDSNKVLPPNQWVSIHGTARYFSGAPASFTKIEAKVNWLQLDQVSYYYFNNDASGYYDNDYKSIKDTLITADENGRFTLTFFSQADSLKKQKKDQYSVFAIDVVATDQAAEEAQVKQYYTATLAAYAAHLWVKEKEQADNFQGVDLAILDHNRKRLNKKVRLKVSELSKPEAYLKKRLWAAPTERYYSSDSLNKLFPGEETALSDRMEDDYLYRYNNNFLDRRKPVRTILDTFISSEQVNKLRFSEKNWKHSCYYKFEVFDLEDDALKPIATRYSFIYNSEDPLITDMAIYAPYPLYKGQQKKSREATVATFTEQPNMIFSNLLQKNVDIKNSKTFKWTCDFSKANGFYLSWAFIYHNRLYTENVFIVNPEDRNLIKFKIDIPDQKLRPGQQVTWPIEINNKNNHNRFEVFASLYDASLDQLIAKKDKRREEREFEGFGHQVVSYSEPFGWRANTESTDAKLDRYTGPGVLIEERLVPAIRLFGSDLFIRQLNDQTINLGIVVLNPEGLKDELEGVSVYGQKIDRRSYTGALNTISTYTNTYSIVSNTKADIQPGNLRKNFTESAYFNAHLVTGKHGKAFIRFTVPDALSKWKLKLFAHDKSFNTIGFETEIITQKDLIVSPHLPRFLRQQDTIDLKVKVSNLSNKTDTVNVNIILKDSLDGQSLNKRFGLTKSSRKIILLPHSSQFVLFPVKVPADFENPVNLVTTAKGRRAEDGEVHTLNIEPGKLLLSETFQVSLNDHSRADFEFTAFKNKYNPQTSGAITVIADKGPVWSALNAYAYLATYPYNCTEQLLNKYLGLTMARQLLDSIPELRTQIDTSQELYTASDKLIQKNVQALKQLNDQTSNNNMMLKIFGQFSERQLDNGSFSWFEGMPGDHNMSVYLLGALTKMNNLGLVKEVQAKTTAILEKGMNYVDAAQLRYLHELKSGNKPVALDQRAIEWLYLNYLQADRKMRPELEAYSRELYLLATSNWQMLDNKNQATIAICLWNKEQQATADQIIQSLLEKSIHKEYMGRYWNWNAQLSWTAGDIETHARILEAFTVTQKNNDDIAAIRQWLLLNKKGVAWGTTISTAAVNMVLAAGNWQQGFASTPFRVQLGDTTFTFNTGGTATGGQSYTIDRNRVSEYMSSIQIVRTGLPHNPVSAHIIWSYQQEMNTMSTGNESGAVKLTKEMYKIDPAKNEPQRLNGTESLTVGDKILVRIRIATDRDLSYILLKDMRCTASEPVEKLSTFKYSNDLAYYQSHQDKASDFFFNHIEKGIWHLEYELIVNQSGHFQSGIATLEDMYRPKVKAYSSGIRLNIQ